MVEKENSRNKLFNREELLGEIQARENEPYNPDAIPQDINKLRNSYAQKGYIVSQIWDEVSVDRQKREVSVTYHIEEGPKTYVRLIKIRGNTKTKDNVIRRKLTIKPGDAFDGDKIKRSREKVYNLGYFDDVKAYTEPADKPELRDLVFEVEEKKTGGRIGPILGQSFQRLLLYLQSDFYIEEIRDGYYDFASRLLKTWWKKYYGYELGGN